MQSGKSLKPLGKTAHLSIGSVTSSISPPPPTPSLVSEGNLTLAYSYCCPGSQVSYMLLSPSLMPHLHLTRSGTEVWPKSNRFLNRLCSLGLKKMNWIHLFPGGNLNKGPPSHKSIFQLAIRLNWTYFLSLNVLGDVMCHPRGDLALLGHRLLNRLQQWREEASLQSCQYLAGRADK